MITKHPFVEFLDSFVPVVEKKSRQLNKATWILETTGSQDAADLKTELDTELRLLFSDSKIYQNLLQWDLDCTLQDPILKRQLNVLIRSFKQNNIPKDLLEEIAKQETALLHVYANFRPTMDGKQLSENEIRAILTEENNPNVRKKTWNASKEIGNVLAPHILSLVKLRNKAAISLGYSDYFQMQLHLQEIDSSWLSTILEKSFILSEKAYSSLLEEIHNAQSLRFQVSKEILGPWAWSEPFCQEDPLASQELDILVQKADFCAISTQFYEKMGFDVRQILRQSDLWERPGKNQHAFCINIDKGCDVRTLNNLKPSMKWLETLLHELGHAIYELGFAPDLPWLLKEPPHMISTEAMALIAGRRAYLSEVLDLLPQTSSHEESISKAKQSLQRRQLIFSRWVLVMTYFEQELYKNPDQDLQKLWWTLVQKYQKISPPSQRTHQNDWAAKYHIGLAPVYYYSYLIGEMFASSIEETIKQKTQSANLASKEAGELLQKKLFGPANTLSVHNLAIHVTGKPLTPDDWIKQYT